MTDTIEATTAEPKRKGLEAMLLPELKQLGASLGLKGTGAMRKGALIEAIKAAQAPAATARPQAEETASDRPRSRYRQRAERPGATEAAKAKPV